jgi:hypothetical protein
MRVGGDRKGWDNNQFPALVPKRVPAQIPLQLLPLQLLEVTRIQRKIIRMILTASVADPGCLSRIPDPTFFHPGSRIRTVSIPDPGSQICIKEFKYFNPQKNQKKGY